jgi:hypothetical protein
MPKVMCLYLDDSGTRNPSRKLPEKFMFRDWFTLGGYLSREEDEGQSALLMRISATLGELDILYIHMTFVPRQVISPG